MMKGRDVELGQSLLALAARTSVKDAFDAVLDELQQAIGEEEVRLAPCPTTECYFVFVPGSRHAPHHFLWRILVSPVLPQ